MLVKELCRAIKSRGYESEIINDLQTVKLRAEMLAAQGELRAVVSAGGDGTADALANLLSNEIPILIFPLGTENLLAKHLQLTANIEDACNTLENGKRTKIDVGSANDKLFLVMASCGFDAAVVNEMHAVRTGHINRWSYTKPIWNAVRKYRFPQLPFQMQSTEAESKTASTAAWIFVFNVPRYAADLDFCPQADPLDGLLDVCTFKKSGLATGLGYLSRLFFRTHQSMRGFAHHRSTEIVIEPPTTSDGVPMQIPYQVDGDPGGFLPLRIRVLPKRLTLLTPAN